MKKLSLLFAILLLTGALTSCFSNTDSETNDSTPNETSSEIIEETGTKTPQEIFEALQTGKLPRAIPAKVIYHLYVDNTTYAERLLLGSIQGLAARLSEEQVLVRYGLSDVNLPTLEEKWGVTLCDTVDGKDITTQALAEHYYPMGIFKGYVLCDEESRDSIEVAISLAGLFDALIATQQTKDMLDAIGYECLMDTTTLNGDWLRESEYFDQLRKDIAFEQDCYAAPNLIDYALFCGGAYFYWLDTERQADVNRGNVFGDLLPEWKEVYNKLYADRHAFLDDNAIVFGFNASMDEYTVVHMLANHNVQLMVADGVYNLSTLSGFHIDSLDQKHIADVDVDAKNVHTVTFIFSDGDNLAWFNGSFATQPHSWYLYDGRGSFDMGWGMPAATIDLLPPLASYVYDSLTERDEFIMFCSGLGYTFTSHWPSASARAQMTEDLAAYMKRSDMHSLLLLDSGGWTEEILSDYTEHEEIDGLFYMDYAIYDGLGGDIIWTNGKPAVSARYVLSNTEEIKNNLLNSIHSSSIDPKSEDSYTFVIATAWTCYMDGIEDVISRFNETVEVVTPSEFLARLTHNCAPTEE